MANPQSGAVVLQAVQAAPPPPQLPSVESQIEGSVKGTIIGSLAPLASVVAPATFGGFAKGTSGFARTPTGFTVSPLAVLWLLPSPIGIVPTTAYKIKPNWWLPAALGPQLPDWVPGATYAAEEATYLQAVRQQAIAERNNAAALDFDWKIERLQRQIQRIGPAPNADDQAWILKTQAEVKILEEQKRAHFAPKVVGPAPPPPQVDPIQGGATQALQQVTEEAREQFWSYISRTWESDP